MKVITIEEDTGLNFMILMMLFSVSAAFLTVANSSTFPGNSRPFRRSVWPMTYCETKKGHTSSS
jgi:hypothetical protein